MSALEVTPVIRKGIVQEQLLIYCDGMCGRIIQSSKPLRFAIVEGSIAMKDGSPFGLAGL